MLEQTLTLDELKERALENVLQEVAERRATVTVQLPDGKQVVIEPKRPLKPLPILKGRIPEGWKDAIYGQS